MALTKPLISIVIVNAPNRKKDLWRCLNSIIHSDYPNWQIIVVDNSDHAGFHHQIQTTFDLRRIKVIKMPYNTGLLGFNIGLANADGDYIMILDDDAALRTDSLTNIIKLFNQLPRRVGVISCPVFDHTSKSFHQPSNSSQQHTFKSFAGASVFKKQVFVQIGFFEHRYFCWNYDDDYTFKLLQAKFKIFFPSKNQVLIDHYSKQHHFRQEQIFLQTRNKFWLNIKYFSWYILPILIVRDLIFILLQPFRRRRLSALFYALSGYLSGIYTCLPFLKERQVLPWSIQKTYLNSQILQDLSRLIHQLHLSKSTSSDS
ncbi:MAG: glycosyltransferase [Patescibacteria group bacterium]|nr:glycosyltransferase [Patescibacteria group bacterium]